MAAFNDARRFHFFYGILKELRKILGYCLESVDFTIFAESQVTIRENLHSSNKLMDRHRKAMIDNSIRAAAFGPTG